MGAVAAITVSAVLSAAVPVTMTAAGAPAPASQSDPVTVVVSGDSAKSAVQAVKAAGGTVTTRLPLVRGVVAELPEGARLPENFTVAPDREVTFASEEEASAPAAASTVRQTLGLPATGNEGAGVTVALVDTGVADVADLAGRVDHIDVTGTGVGDGYGHGTYLAGLIVGSGASSDGRYQGVAPGARLLDVKVADDSGSTSLAMVLQGLQQVANTADQYGTDIVSLSLSSGSPMPYQVDPLNQALRRLWHRGLPVVVAAGNDGPEAGTVSSPGNDPTLLTVGGIDEASTPVHADDTIAAWSSRGPTNQGVDKPDLAAPGARVVGLRSPGSHVDVAYPQARVEEAYFRGSGTSASTAVTSAAIANVLAVNPDLGPDQIKYLFTSTAYQSAGLTRAAGAGAGGVDVKAALAEASSAAVRSAAPKPTAAPGNPAKWVAVSAAFADGDREASVAAWGELSPAARSWAARSWAALDPTARSWAARSWAARSWATTDVTSDEWAARSWAARSWAGEEWAARSWAARSWAGEDWAARSWAARSWAARSWAGDDWAARSWAGDTWSARSWAAAWR